MSFTKQAKTIITKIVPYPHIWNYFLIVTFIFKVNTTFSRVPILL